MAEDDPIRLDIRLSGQVRRYHTYPIIGQQTIAEHCWNLMRIYLSITDTIDSHMVHHIMFHDIGETVTGDSPYPVKHDNPELKKQMDSVEQKSYCRQLEHWNAFSQVRLTEQDRLLFKQIELIEMAEFGMDQVCFGNNHGFIVADRCLKAVYEQKPSDRLIDYIIKRLNLFQQQASYHFPLAENPWWEIGEWEKLHVSE